MLVMQKEDAPLYKVMACLLDVKKRSKRTEASFGPLHDTVRLPTLSIVCHEVSATCKVSNMAM